MDTTRSKQVVVRATLLFYMFPSEIDLTIDGL
jgi:hypothetical protein